MVTSLIIGSGPAAAGAAMALAADPRQHITVVDVGGVLEPERAAARSSLAGSIETEWEESALRSISRHAVKSPGGTLPEKRAYGSDFPFRDFGQLEGVQAEGDANRSVVSGAYGGFSNVWGAQIMPFSRATFSRWPVTYDEMIPHYQVALGEMSLTAEEDDLADIFPLLAPAHRLPELSDRTRQTLERYQRHRGRLQTLGVTLGRARLALRPETCTRCGLCMTGCPYGLIYSASQTFDRLRQASRVSYRDGLLAIRLAESDGMAAVDVRDVATGTVSRLTADRIFVACGAIGTTRLVLGSLGRFGRPISLAESVQFVMPAVSLAPARDPREERNFTLNQFNLLYDEGGSGVDLSQIHFYPYNPVFLDELPGFFRTGTAEPLTTALLRRLSVGLGYLPSWASPTIEVVAHNAGEGQLPGLEIRGTESGPWPPMLKNLVRTLVRVAPDLDLWPVLPKASVSPAGKSYHFGGSFPHHTEASDLTTDRLGRLSRWRNIHLIDASVFPTVPATTFTLTIMANAHRIASETVASTATAHSGNAAFTLN